MTYAILMLLSLAGPLALSFDKKVNYRKYFFSILFSAFLIAIPFLIWDYFFTAWGVWGFNNRYLMGIHLLNLPIEEVSFFFIIPFCCLFIHEVLKAYYNPKVSETIILVFFVLSVFFSVYFIVLYHDRSYTLWSISLYLLLVLIGYVFFRSFLGQFVITYLVCIVPFLLVNGVLTGYFTEEPIVWYNNNENLATRIASIPLEDFFYNFDLLFSNLILNLSLRKYSLFSR